jgi:hypothetical protein
LNVPRFLVSVGSTRVVLNDLQVGPRDDMAPQPGRPAVVFPLLDCFAAGVPPAGVADGAWALYRDAQGLSDADRPAYAVTAAGPGTVARVLEVVADDPGQALEKYKIYCGIVGSAHEPYVAELAEGPPARKKGA